MNRKYRKQINRNGWMARLYKFSTGSEPNFTGYCPFFWSVWFWVLMFPITVAGRAFEWMVKVILSFNYKEVEDDDVKNCWPKPQAGDIVFAYEHYDTDQSFYISYRTQQWMENTPNWKDFYPAALKEVEKERAKEELAEKRAEYRAALAAKAYKYVKWLIKPAIAASAVFAAYLIYHILGHFFSVITLDSLWGAAKILFWLGLIGAAVWTTIWGMKNVKNLFNSAPTVKKEPFFLVSLVVGLFKGIFFIFETIGMIYKKECPLIEWSDETKPIEKI